MAKHQTERDAIRCNLKRVMSKSSFSRAAIAEQISELVGVPVTEKMLHNFLAESRADVRWPAEFDIAFCQVLGDYSLLSERVERAGFRMIGPDEERLIEIGRAYTDKLRAAKFLRGVQLG